ncbi:MAG: VWA domain-containing protein [Solirubrobacterales bacterium]|nr:VWA domain-containing protein [Solirubrobacterales bacterium]
MSRRLVPILLGFLSALALVAVVPGRAVAAPAPPMAGGADCVPPNKLGVAFVMDDSGSNLTTDFDELRRDGALAGVASLPDGSAMSVSTFSDEAETRVGTTDLTAANRAALLAGVRDMPLSALGGTNYEAAFVDAIAKLGQMSSADKRIVIFLTDGQPTESFSSDAQIGAMGVPIFSLGYGSSDQSILQGISAKTGGKAYSLQSSADARTAFSDILDTLTCRSVFDPTDPTLPPGETYERPFSVGTMTTYFRATVAWDTGTQPQSIEFVRPDGTRFPISGPARPNESLVEGEGSVQLAVDDPTVGKWKVRVKGDPSQPVELTVDAATASDVDVGTCPSGVSGTQKVQIGEATAFGCFTDEGGGRYTTAYPARIGGFDADPDNDNIAPGNGPSLLILNTAERKIETQGHVSLGLGGALLPGSPKLLPIREKSFELTLDKAIKCAPNKPDCVLGRSPVSDLEAADVDLWGFDVAGKVKASWIGDGNGGAQLQLSPSIDKILGPLASKIFSGKEPVLASPGGAPLVNATLKVTATNDKGFDLGVSELKISPFELVDKASGSGTATTRLNWPVGLSATGDRASFGDTEGYLWRFEVAVGFPQSAGLKISRRVTAEGSPELGVAGRVFVFDGSVAGGGAEASGLNIPLGTSPVFLQRASLDLLFAPGFGLDAQVGLSGGPKFAGASVIEGDPIAVRVGTLAKCQTSASPDNLPFQVAGTLKIPAAEAAGATTELTADLCYIAGDNAIEGKAGVKVLFLGDTAGITGEITGWIDDSKFNLDGNGAIKIPGLPDPEGSVVLSSVGVAGCGGVAFFKGGVGYKWGESVDVFSGCDLSPWQQPRPSRLVPNARIARVGGDPNTFKVRKGMKFVGFRVNAAGGAPVVRVTGPDGTVYDSPFGAQGTMTETLVTTRVDQLGQAFVFINKPKPGKYTVSQLGGPAITSIQATRPLAAPKVRGSVKRGGKGKRTLRYRVRPIDGQRVIFYERGRGSAKRLGTAKHRHGKIRYRPARGGSGKRRIVAEVVQGGLPRTSRRLDRYKVQPLGRAPGKVRRISLRGSGKRGYTLTWSKARGAKRYYVRVRYRGRTLSRGVSKRRLRLGNVSRKALRAEVQPARGSRVGKPTKRGFKKRGGHRGGGHGGHGGGGHGGG